MALSYSHQPQSVNVRSTTCASSVLPSMAMGRVNLAPILGSTPNRESTRVSAAACVRTLGGQAALDRLDEVMFGLASGPCS